MSRTGIVALCLCIGLAAPLAAEPPSEERIALVTEFLQVTEVGNGAAALRGAFVGRIEQTYPQTFEEMLGELSLDDAEAAKARAGYEQSLGRFRADFANLFDAQVDLPVLSRVLYAPIYLRHFSDSELREMIAFYRTPTGKKSLMALPQAMGEVTRDVVPALAPLITSLVNEAVAREKTALRAALAGG